MLLPCSAFDTLSSPPSLILTSTHLSPFSTIRVLGVFTTTAFYSTFAYLWLLIVLTIWTPDVVTVEEAVITFLLFPAVVAHSYHMDRKAMNSGAVVAAEAVPVGTIGPGASGFGIRKSILYTGAQGVGNDDESGSTKSALKVRSLPYRLPLHQYVCE